MLSIPVDENLLLRTYTTGDAPALFQVVDANRAHLRPWLNWVDATTKEEHSKIFIEDTLAQLRNQEGIALGIFHKQQIIGGIGMLQWNHTLKKAQIGYWIAKEYEGKGIISKCLKNFLDFSFAKLALNKIEIRFVASNKRSAAITRKFKAKVEGVLRESYLRNGKLEDLVITGILKREYCPKPAE